MLQLWFTETKGKNMKNFTTDELQRQNSTLGVTFTRKDYVQTEFAK